MQYERVLGTAALFAVARHTRNESWFVQDCRLGRWQPKPNRNDMHAPLSPAFAWQIFSTHTSRSKTRQSRPERGKGIQT